MAATAIIPAFRPEPRPFEWTRERYYAAADAGAFHGRRVELIGGRILEMAPQRNLHVYCVTRATDAMRQAFGANHWVRVQAPLSLGRASDPEPDVAVVAGPPTPSPGNPDTALIVVEVSDTTLPFDQGEKASLYASAGIEDYWIVNVLDRRLEVRRNPAPDSAAPFGFRYTSVGTYSSAQRIAPLRAPSALIPVKDLLP